MRIGIFAVLLATGCNITETGNPELGSFAVTARTSAPEQVALGEGRRAAGQVVVEEAWVAIGELRFVQAEVCDGAGETGIDVAGPGLVDLVAEPEAVTIELPADDYCRIRVELERADDGNALVVSGTRGDGASFTIVSRDEQEADVRSRGAPFAVTEGGAALLLTFDVAAWFDGVPLEDAVAGPDGHVLIADDSNGDILEAFEERVEESLALYEDTDGDLVVGPGEEPVAEGGI